MPSSIIGKGHCVWRSQMSFFSWFKHEFIFPDVRTLNATIFVHPTPNSIIGKKYYVWRLQVSYLVDLSTSPYVLMLERWIIPFSFMQRPTVLLVRILCMKIANEFLSWFQYELICSDVRALNATFNVHSTPNSIIGKGYFVWISQMSFFSWFNHEFMYPDVRALNSTISLHSTPNSIIGKEYCVWRS